MIYAVIFFTVALLVRSAYVLKAAPQFDMDNERYIFLARALSAGDFRQAVHFHYPPLLPLAIALGKLLAGNFESASRAVAVLASSLTIFPVYYIARWIFGRKTALMACSFLALRFFSLTSFYLAEQLANLLIYLGILSGLLALKKKNGRLFFVSGLIFGLGFLAKPEAEAYFLLFLIIAAAVLSWRIRTTSGEQAPKPQRFRSAALALLGLLAGYFLAAAPYLAAYHRTTGIFSFNPKARTLFILHNLYIPRYAQYSIQHDEKGFFTPAQRIYMEGDEIPLKGSPLLILWNNRDSFPKIYFRRLGLSLRHIVAGYYLQSIAPWLWPVLMLVGLWPGRTRESRLREFYLHLFALVPIFSVPLFSAEFPRFYFSMTPWFMLVMGRGVARFGEMFTRLAGKRVKTRRLAGPVLALFSAALLGFAVRDIKSARPEKAYWDEVNYRRELAQKLKQLLPPGCRFMAELENQSLWYLAGLAPTRQEILPMAELERVVRFAIQTGCKYLVFHPSIYPGRYQELNSLLEPGFSFPHLKPVFRGTSPGGKVYVIYEIDEVKCGR